MRLPTFKQFGGVVIILNTLLPMLLMLTLIWIYVFHFNPLIEEFRRPFFSDLASIENVLEKYRATKKVAAEAYKPIAELSEDIAFLSVAVCTSPRVEKILSFRNETLAAHEPWNNDFHSKFVRARFESAGSHMILGQSAGNASARLRYRFSDSVITTDLKDWYKKRVDKERGKFDPNPTLEPPGRIFDPKPDRSNPSAAVTDLASMVKDHAQAISDLRLEIARLPGETCSRVESHFEAVFFVFSSIFSLFDEIETALSNLGDYLDVDVEAVWLKASNLYQVVKYTGIAISFWLLISYVTWVFGRLERGWTMIAGK